MSTFTTLHSSCWYISKSDSKSPLRDSVYSRPSALMFTLHNQTVHFYLTQAWCYFDGHCVDSVDHSAGSRTQSWAHPTCQQSSQFLWPSFTQPSRHVVSVGRAHHFAKLCSAVWISCITANDIVFWNVFITVVFDCLLKVILKLSVGNPEKSSWFLRTDQNLQSW